ncbi:MAG: site-specific integrase [Deltaproteobacteria bacterium]|nr:site-specific integrase [Deltaproteobacteria bacterium]MBW2567220.1 site-specific integrase [Deltaproteobacteria bacterium]
MLTHFDNQFGDRELSSVTPDEVLTFLNRITEGTKQTTKRTRYSCLKAFFNLIRHTLDLEIQNPCNAPMVKKLFKWARNPLPDILEKEVVDEIIFRTPNPRNRLILELMARGGMRVGEVLQLTPRDVQERKLVLRQPKSGKESEPVFIPKKVADRLRQYIREEDIRADQRIFPLTYAGARWVVVNAGKEAGIHVRPHDLRRYAATYASRSGTPIEIVSKVILRHANLSTTQQYLGKVTDEEAMRWIDNLHA